MQALSHSYLLAALSALPVVAFSQSFTFELVEVSRQPHRVIASTSIDLKSRVDINAAPEAPGSKVMKRELRLPGGWAVGCSDYREPTPKGFGCWLGRRPSKLSLDQYDGFSWEWFDLESTGKYIKRQGGARAHLKVAMDGGVPAMESLEFLEDMIFSANVGPLEAGKETHQLRITRGSLLPLMPSAAR
jgi:hypothetical protein